MLVRSLLPELRGRDGARLGPTWRDHIYPYSVELPKPEAISGKDMHLDGDSPSSLGRYLEAP